MPRINDRLLDCVFFLYENEEEAQNGERGGGTGFFVSVLSPKSPSVFAQHMYAVTCKHLVKPNQAPAAFPIMRVNTYSGDPAIFPSTPEEWVCY
jgi:hypothetical protein